MHHISLRLLVPAGEKKYRFWECITQEIVIWTHLIRGEPKKTEKIRKIGWRDEDNNGWEMKCEVKAIACTRMHARTPCEPLLFSLLWLCIIFLSSNKSEMKVVWVYLINKWGRRQGVFVSEALALYVQLFMQEYKHTNIIKGNQIATNSTSVYITSLCENETDRGYLLHEGSFVT